MTSEQATAKAGTHKSWRTVLPIHPAAAAYPRMTAEELAELGRNIKARGLQVPIVLIREDEEIRLLDGISRLDALEANGIQLVEFGHIDPMLGLGAGNRTRIVTDVDDPYALAASLNAHRRHLTPEEKRARIEAALKQNPQKSDRMIAEQEKVSPTLVGKVRKSTARGGQLKRTGADGRSRRLPRPSSKAVENPPLKEVADAVKDREAATSALVTAAMNKVVAAKVQEEVGELDERSRVRVAELEHEIGHLKLAHASEIDELKAALKPRVADTKDTVYCSFCNKSQHDVDTVIASPPFADAPAHICNECVKACSEMLDAAPAEPAKRRTVKDTAPEPVAAPDYLDIPTALYRFTPDEARAVIAAINRQNNDTSWRLDPDGHGGAVMVTIDSDGEVDGEPEKADLIELATDFEIDIAQIRARVAKSASIRVIPQSVH